MMTTRIDQRLHIAEGLLAGRRTMSSGLAMLSAAVALVLSSLLLIFLVTMGPKAIAQPAENAPQADFQLSGSAFPDAKPMAALPSGSEQAR